MLSAGNLQQVEPFSLGHFVRRFGGDVPGGVPPPRSQRWTEPGGTEGGKGKRIIAFTNIFGQRTVT
jgi:hypothetical protein